MGKNDKRQANETAASSGIAENMAKDAGMEQSGAMTQENAVMPGNGTNASTNGDTHAHDADETPKPGATDGATQDRLIASQLRKQRKMRIRIASGRDSHERCPVPVAVNGREFLIERDRDVDVPEGVVNVLRLANAQVAQTENRGGQTSTSFHKAARFGLSIMGYVDENGELCA